MAAQDKFYIKVREELVEVTQEVYLTYYRARRRELAQIEKERRHRVLSYDAFGTSGALGAEMLADTASDEPEDLVITRLMAKKLHACLSKLSEEERRLVQLLFFENASERAAALRLGLSAMTVHNRKERILAKLLKLMRA